MRIKQASDIKGHMAVKLERTDYLSHYLLPFVEK